MNSRREFLGQLGKIAVGVYALNGLSFITPPQKNKNVLFINVDDLHPQLG